MSVTLRPAYFNFLEKVFNKYYQNMVQEIMLHVLELAKRNFWKKRSMKRNFPLNFSFYVPNERFKLQVSGTRGL